MNKYIANGKMHGGIPQETSTCVDTKKSVKERLVEAQDTLDFCVAINERGVVDYDKAMEAVGRAYTRVAHLKDQLKRMKKGKA